MPATAETIWMVPVYLPCLQPPLTSGIIAQAEKQIGFSLPSEYISLLKKQNGGYIRFTLPETAHRMIAGIGPHFPSLTAFDWEECQDYVSYPLDGLIPFDGDGHWHLCLDYRNHTSYPAVSLIDVECDSQATIANTFADYLDQLQVIADDEFVVENATEVDEVISRLSEALGVTFDPPDRYAHGYPIYRANAGKRKRREWIWLSPNLVERGFVREDDPRHSELCNLMPGEAPRYPEIPDSSFILSATDGIRPKVIDACNQAAFNIRSLREYLN